MENNISRETERRGTRRVMVTGVAVACVVGLGIIGWSLYPGPKLPAAPGGTSGAAGNQTYTEHNKSAQTSAESGVARNDPAGLGDPSGGRARNIKESSKPLQLSQSQRQQLHDIISKQGGPSTPSTKFELQIGVSVPKQVELRDLPPAVAQVMNGFWGDQYTMVDDKLIIVDQHSRRVAAIVPGMT